MPSPHPEGEAVAANHLEGYLGVAAVAHHPKKHWHLHYPKLLLGLQREHSQTYMIVVRVGLRHSHAPTLEEGLEAAVVVANRPHSARLWTTAPVLVPDQVARVVEYHLCPARYKLDMIMICHQSWKTNGQLLQTNRQAENLMTTYILTIWNLRRF